MLGGVGVPLRLSANEVGDEASPRTDGDSVRTRRSSMGSSQWLNASDTRSHLYNERSTPTGGPVHGKSNGGSSIAEMGATSGPVEDGYSNEYFASAPPSRISGSSSETEFGEVGQMHAPPAAGSAKKEEGKSAEELRRRGSVDERANTMTGVRLFVANPDLSD